MPGCPACARIFEASVEFCPEHRLELDPLVGAHVGRYRVGKRLGRGGMGAVYLGEHLDIGSRVALKFMEARHAQDRRLVDRFLREARAVNLVEHENVVRVTDHAVTDSGRPYLVMELLDGKPLASLVGQPQPLSVTGPILLQVAEGLQAAHDRGIVHRDLKPDNVLLVNRNRRQHVVKIIDFGIAKVQAAADITNTATGTMMGTWHYMSPEQVQGGEVGPASDIYAFGVMTYLLSTGQFPFDGDAAKILVAHVTQPPPPPTAIVPDLPEPLEALILKCLQKPAKERPASMGEVADTLAGIMDALGLSKEPPLAPRAPVSSTPTPTPDVAQLPTRLGAPTPAPTRVESPMSTPAGTVLLLPDADAATVHAAPEAAAVQRPARGVSYGLVGSVAALALGAGFAVYATRREPPPPVSVPAVLRLRVDAFPAGARATVVQGSQRIERPVPVSLELDLGEPIELVVEADGHVAQVRRFDGHRDVDVTLQLKAVEDVPPVAPVVPVAVPKPVAAAPAPAPAPVAAKPPVPKPAPAPATAVPSKPVAPKPAAPSDDSGGLMPMDFGAN